MTAAFPGSVKSFGTPRINGDVIPASDANDVRDEIVAIETALLGGWLAQSETWTYASVATFTVIGDRTSYYTKGRRLRWVQGGTTKYGIVVSSSYGAPNTTVTIIVNTDYVITNVAITAPAVSDLDNPQGWPEWFNYAPTWSCSGTMTFTGVTTQQAMYRASGRTVAWILRGTGTTGGTNQNEIRATTPTTPVSLTGANVPCAVNINDNGYIAGRGALDTSTGLIAHTRADNSVWSLGAGRIAGSEGFYQW